MSRADGGSPSTDLAATLWPSLAVSIACAAFLMWRVAYGADLTDEPFYLATARQFAMGARPFVDSWSALQLSGWLVSPLVRVWESVAGGSDGLVLAMRWAYVLLSLASAGASVVFLRRIFGLRLALLASGVPLVLIPFLLPTLSYNTLAMVFVGIGTSLVALSAAGEERAWPAALGGIAFALAVVAYPTLCVVLVPAVLLTRLVSPSWRVPVIATAAMFLTGLVLAVPLIGLAPGLADVMAFNRAIGARYAGGARKLAQLVIGGARVLVREPLVWVAAVVGALRVARRLRTPWWAGAAMLVLTAVTLASDPLHRSLYQGLWLLLGALAIGPPAGLPRPARSALSWVLCVGGAVGLTIGFSSTNAYMNVGIGALAVGATAIAVLAAGVEEGAGAGQRGAASHRTWVALASVAMVAVFAIVTGSQVTYRDEPPLTLTATVPSGPFAGLHTTPGRVAYLADAARLVTPRAKGGSRLTVYGAAPWVYLLGEAAPVAPQVWLAEALLTTPASSDALRSYFAMPGHRPDVVVAEHAGQFAPEVRASVLSALYGAPFSLVESGASLEVWVRE